MSITGEFQCSIFAYFPCYAETRLRPSDTGRTWMILKYLPSIHSLRSELARGSFGYPCKYGPSMVIVFWRRCGKQAVIVLLYLTLEQMSNHRSIMSDLRRLGNTGIIHTLIFVWLMLDYLMNVLESQTRKKSNRFHWAKCHCYSYRPKTTSRSIEM